METAWADIQNQQMLRYHPFFIIFVVQALILLFFGLFVTYDVGFSKFYDTTTGLLTTSTAANTMVLTDFDRYYKSLSDIFVMIIVGFGILLASTKSHSWTSVGFCFLFGVMSIEVAVLTRGLWKCVMLHQCDSISLGLPEFGDD